MPEQRRAGQLVFNKTKTKTRFVSNHQAQLGETVQQTPKKARASVCDVSGAPRNHSKSRERFKMFMIVCHNPAYRANRY